MRWLLFWCCFGKEGSFARDAGLAAASQRKDNTWLGLGWRGCRLPTPAPFQSMPSVRWDGLRCGSLGCLVAWLLAWFGACSVYPAWPACPFFLSWELPVLMVCLCLLCDPRTMMASWPKRAAASRPFVRWGFCCASPAHDTTRPAGDPDHGAMPCDVRPAGENPHHHRLPWLIE